MSNEPNSLALAHCAHSPSFLSVSLHVHKCRVLTSISTPTNAGMSLTKSHNWLFDGQAAKSQKPLAGQCHTNRESPKVEGDKELVFGIPILSVDFAFVNM